MLYRPEGHEQSQNPTLSKQEQNSGQGSAKTIVIHIYAWLHAMPAYIDCMYQVHPTLCQY